MNKKKMLAVLAALGPAAAFAEGEATGTAVHPAVTTAITNLESAASNYATAILPYIVSVGLAFIGIAVIYLLFKVFRRFVGGK